MNLPSKKSYRFTNKSYELEQILTFYKQNRIDTELDCQRGYVWTDDRKQQLIDTLINSERIPEFHVIKEDDEAIYHIADGKQRITTIILFLTNKLPWKKTDALLKSNPEFQKLFGKNHQIFFNDLPENYRNMILSTEVSFALYSDMTPATITKLFRKLNNGAPLEEFAKMLAGNITIKKYFLDDLMRHPVIQRIFSEARIQKGNAEQALLRTMILMMLHDKGDAYGPLRPPDLQDYLLDVENASQEEVGAWLQALGKYQTIIKKYLDWLHTDSESLSINADYICTFSLFFAYRDKLDEETLRVLFHALQPITAATILGNGADYSSTNVHKYIDYIDNLLYSEGKT